MYIHIQMNLTMEVLRMGWLLPPYGFSAPPSALAPPADHLRVNYLTGATLKESHIHRQFASENN